MMQAIEKPTTIRTDGDFMRRVAVMREAMEQGGLLDDLKRELAAPAGTSVSTALAVIAAAVNSATMERRQDAVAFPCASTAREMAEVTVRASADAPEGGALVIDFERTALTRPAASPSAAALRLAAAASWLGDCTSSDGSLLSDDMQADRLATAVAHALPLLRAALAGLPELPQQLQDYYGA